MAIEARTASPKQTHPPTGSPAPPTTRSGTRAGTPAGDHRARRGPAPRGRSTSATCASSSPCTSSPRRSAPRAAGAPPAQLGRLRPVPQGARRASTRRGPSTSAGRCRADPTRGSATPRGPSTSRRRCARRSPRWAWRWRRSARPSATGRRLPRADPARGRSDDDIEAVLARYRTKAGPPRPRRRPGARRLGRRRRGRLGRRGRPGALPLQALLPRVRPRHDDRHVVRRRDDRPRLHLHRVRLHGVTNLATQDEGKLVWKVDWPMRWAFEGVDFEPGGVDHATPGSSYTVGKELVEEVFGGRAPSLVRLRLRRLRGRCRRCRRRAGRAHRRADALRILEAPILRWLYVRRKPKQAFNIDFGPRSCGCTTSGTRWTRKAADPGKRDAQVLALERAPPRPPARCRPRRWSCPFRVLSSVADVTAGSAEQISRIVAWATSTRPSTTSSHGSARR